MPDASVENALHLQVRHAALLHDVGKFVQRAKSLKEYHWVVGSDFLKVCGYNEAFFRPVAEAVRYHHGEIPALDPATRDIVDMVRLADHWDASQRERDYESERGNPRTTPLSTFFNEKLNFPVLRFSDAYDNWKPTPRTELTYKDAAKGFEDAFQKVSGIKKEPARFAALNTVLRDYFSFVPSYTQTDCTISLYDHSKAVAALASCIYLYRISRGRLPEKGDKAFLLIGGDFVGIQDFIYSIRRGAEKGEAGKRFAKRLRGRSLIVQMAAHLAVDHLLDSLSLGPESIIFCSGGNFAILCPNTEEAKKSLAQCERDLSPFFRKNTEPLWLALAAQEFAASSLDREKDRFYDEVWFPLGKALQKKKLRRDMEQLDAILDAEERSRGRCIYCGAPADTTETAEDGTANFSCGMCTSALKLGETYNTEEDLCIVCERGQNAGERAIAAPSLDRTVRVVEAARLEAIREGAVLKALFNPSHEKERKVSLQWAIDAASRGGAVSIEYRPISSGKEFLELAAIADKPDRAFLGYLMMDVDNLSKEFKKVRLLADLSAFSTQLDLFFCRGLDATISTRLGPERIYLVYSGGDDLFAVGRWDDVVELAAAVQKELHGFYGDKLTVSGGIALCRPRMPLYAAATLVQAQLRLAKRYPRGAPQDKETKNAVGMFDLDLKWDNFNATREFAQKLTQATSDGISTSLLYNMLTLMQDESLRARPSRRNSNIHYMVARHLSSKRPASAAAELLVKLKDQLCQSGPGEKSEEYRKTMLILSLALLRRRTEE